LVGETGKNLSRPPALTPTAAATGSWWIVDEDTLNSRSFLPWRPGEADTRHLGVGSRSELSRSVSLQLSLEEGGRILDQRIA